MRWPKSGVFQIFRVFEVGGHTADDSFPTQKSVAMPLALGLILKFEILGAEGHHKSMQNDLKVPTYINKNVLMDKLLFERCQTV